MAYTVTRTIIAGGGIVGLTVGRALLRAGMEVIVAEKADAIRAAGATLGLWANAVRVFDDLDVDVRSVGREAEMYFHGTSGQPLKTPEFGEEDHRYLLVHRASLNNLLAESVGYDNIRLEATVAGFEEHQDGVTVRFTDGSTEDADLLIGADGLYSRVRAQLSPGTDDKNTPGTVPGGRSSRLSTSACPTTGSSLAAGTEPGVDTSAPPMAPCSGCCRSSARRHRPHR